MNLTPEQRRLMYGEDENTSNNQKNANLTEDNNLKVLPSNEMALIESNGKRIAVPTINSYRRLLQENQNLKADLQQTLKQIKALKEAIKQLDRDLSYVEDELKHKADKVR